LLIAGVKVDSSAKHLLSYLPSAAAIGLIIFDNWIWRTPWILKLHARPRLHGLWRVELRPDPLSRGPITAYMVVEQSFWSVCLTQLTQESASHSKATAYVRRPGTKQQTLSFTYENEPRREHLPRSPRHVGACELNLSAGSPISLTGTYYTDRFTAGEMSLTLVDRSTKHANFAAAATAAGEEAS
jgi:hypothetical protein